MDLFDQLREYRGLTEGPVRFEAVQELAIKEAEETMGVAFPDQLRSFYAAVGYGWIATDEDKELNNLIIHPLDVADLFLGLSPFCPDFSFRPGDLPFFDSGWSRFLVVRPASDQPNRVYRDDGELVSGCRDFLDFVQKLLADPSFYLEG